MAYKNFTAGATLPYTDVQNYLMDQAVITVPSSGRPTATHDGFTIYETDTDLFQFSDVNGWIPIRNKILYATSTASASTTTTTYVKDSGVGDISFSVTNTNVLYRYTYVARVNSDAAATTMDFRIYDGGVSSPTTASTQIAGASQYVSQVGGPGGAQLICMAIATATTGTHTVAAFYGRTVGTGNVNVSQSTGEFRMLSVEALTVI